MTRNFKFIEVGYREKETEIKYFENALLYSTDEFLPEKPIIVAIDFPGVLPTKGISYIDENNV